MSSNNLSPRSSHLENGLLMIASHLFLGIARDSNDSMQDSLHQDLPTDQDISQDISQDTAQDIETLQQKDVSTGNTPPPTPWIDTDTISGLRLKKRMTSVVDMEMRLMTCRFIPVHRLEEHAALFHATRIGVKPLSDWATVGVIDRCLTKDKFTVAKVTNLRGHYFHVFIFGLPHRQYRLKVGSVIAIYRPIVLQPTELNSSVALYVNDKKQIWVVGESKDLAKCQAFVSSDKQCDVMIDSRAGEFCDSHIKRAFGLSRNTRMELASGDTGLDVRWTQQRQTKQGTLYQATSNRKSWKEDSYVIQGKGVFKSDGTQKKVHNTPTKDLLPKHDKALCDFLEGKSDPGAEMIRRIKGIPSKSVTSSSALSREAMTRMGMSRKDISLSEKELEAKKRSIDALLTNDPKKKTKKTRYIDLE